MIKNNSILKHQKGNISNVFPSVVFWDCNLNNLDMENWQDRSFVIQRVLKRSGSEGKYLDQLESYFSIEEIKYYANDSMEIMGNELIEMLCERYHMQHSQFPYYIENVS